MPLDWLKPILGESYTEELDAKIAQEIGRSFVSRADFNSKNEELKQTKSRLQASKETLESLRSEGSELTARLNELRAQSETAKQEFEAKITAMRVDTAVDRALAKAGARNKTAARALLAEFLQGAQPDSNGDIPGLDEQLNALSKAEDTAFMFTQKPAAPQIHGMKPGEAADTAGEAEQGRFELRLAKAREQGNHIEVVAIKREAAEGGIILS